MKNIVAVEICSVINNSAANCLISLKFGRNFDHLTADVLQCSKQDQWIKIIVCHVKYQQYVMSGRNGWVD